MYVYVCMYSMYVYVQYVCMYVCMYQEQRFSWSHNSLVELYLLFNLFSLLLYTIWTLLVKYVRINDIILLACLENRGLNKCMKSEWTITLATSNPENCLILILNIENNPMCLCWVHFLGVCMLDVCVYATLYSVQCTWLSFQSVPVSGLSLEFHLRWQSLTCYLNPYEEVRNHEPP